MTILLVYGTLKRGYGNHYILKGSEFLGEAVTESWFVMRCVGFPHVSRENKHPIKAWGRVAGELYEVDDMTLARLDRLEGNGRMYQRQVISVKRKKRTLKAEMYVAMAGLAASGTPVAPSPDGILTWNQPLD
jgi:gamma-glutamylaminecyclotransferase